MTFDPKILIVDGNHEPEAGLTGLVADLGFPAMPCVSAFQARSLLLEKRFDIALIDLELADSAGLELLETVRRWYPKCLCLALGPAEKTGSAVEALNGGALRYLRRESSADEIRSAIRDALSLARERQEVDELLELDQLVLDHFPGKILVLDRDGRIIHLNDFPLPVRNCASHDATTIESAFDHAEHWGQKILEQYRLSLHTGEPMTVPDLLIPKEDGTTSRFKVHCVPLQHSVARTLLFLIEEPAGPAKLDRASPEFEPLAVIGEMASTVAHEIKNPLSGISSAIQILRDRLRREGLECDICDEVIERIHRLDRTVEDLLVYAKPVRASSVTVSLRDVVESHLTILEGQQRCRSTPNSEVRLESRTRDDRCEVDPFLLRQALANVVLNATEAMGGAGGVLIVIERSAESDGDQISLRVLDEGPGVPQNVLSLFQPFFTTKPSGTGLGLPITRKILEANGGTVSLRNRQDRRGAEVVFRLPAAP